MRPEVVPDHDLCAKLADVTLARIFREGSTWGVISTVGVLTMVMQTRPPSETHAHVRTLDGTESGDHRFRRGFGKCSSKVLW